MQHFYVKLLLIFLPQFGLIRAKNAKFSFLAVRKVRGKYANVRKQFRLRPAKGAGDFPRGQASINRYE
jgi:hypothetical protein